MNKYQVQIKAVRSGKDWGGQLISGSGWQPFFTGTLNQTDTSDEEASTYTSYDDAQAALDFWSNQLDLEGFETNIEEV